MNINLAISPSPGANNITNAMNNNNSQQHPQPHPQQQQRQHQHSHTAITPIPNHRSNDARQQPHLPLSQPTDDKTNPTSPKSRDTAGQ